MTLLVNATEVREGDVLAGKYRVDRVLGVGGMGVVVAAQHLYLDEQVAIKFLRPEALSNQETVARFAREAKAAVKIKSEHVARVIDVGSLETGAPYIVMEFLQGGDLSDWLHSRGPLPVEQAIEFLLQASEAIAEAHSLGIVHRDLKPANLFVVKRADGVLSVKVLDFGISKMSGLSASGPEMSMTKTSAVMGSPYYMSPEQVQSARSADLRTDIWALGVILYELVSGRVPFAGDTMPELILKIMSARPEPLRQVRPEVPPGLEAVIERCLAKDRNERFSNISEFASALGPFAPKRALPSIERVARVLEEAGQASVSSMSGSDRRLGGSTVAAWGNTDSRAVDVAQTRRRQAIVVMLGIFAVLLVGGIALFVRFMVASHGAAATAASEGVAGSAKSATPAAAQPAGTPSEPGPGATVLNGTGGAAPAPVVDVAPTATAPWIAATPPRPAFPREAAPVAAPTPRGVAGGTRPGSRKAPGSQVAPAPTPAPRPSPGENDEYGGRL